MIKQDNSAQNGFSLALALVFAGVLASVLASLSFVQRSENIRREAEIAGIEGAKVASAARVYARNQFVTRPNLVNDLATATEEVTVADLINAALLPPNFMRQNASGDYLNALGQPVRIFMANYPVDGNPADNSTVPTAYVIFEDTGKTNPNIMQNIVQSIRAYDVAVSAPVYSGSVNVTGSCDGGADTIALWDTGCLDTNDYVTLTGGESFAPGSFVIPVWRTVNFDTRAIVRFPQPEQTGLQTMFIDLEMANMRDCDANDDGVLDQNLVTVPSDSGSVTTELCDAISDDVAALVDNRRDIVNINNMSSVSAILIDPQTGADMRQGVATPIADNTEDFALLGDMIVDRGDGTVFSGDTLVGNALSVDKNLIVSGGASATAPATARVSGDISSGNGAFNDITVSQTYQGNRVGISNTMSNTNNVTISDNFIIQDLTRNPAGANAEVTVGNNAAIGGTLNVNDMLVTGNTNISGYSVITANTITDNATVSGGLTSNALINVNGRIDTPLIDITNGGSAECIGDCPRRRQRDQCQNLANNGLLTINGFSSVEDCIENL